MNPFEAIVIISIFAIIASVIKSKQRTPRNAEHSQSNHNNPDACKELQLEITALKKRIEALEAIVTDKSYNLKREIDDL